MIRWLVNRTLQAAVTFLAAMILAFFLMRLSPGDPLARLSADRSVTQAERDALERRFGLDQPAGKQFTGFVGGIFRGDLGVSIGYYPSSVTDLIKSRLPATLLLGATVLLLNFGLGTMLGVWQAANKGSPGDRWLSLVSLTGYAMPSFWLGLGLVWLFSVTLRIFPPSGMMSPHLATDATWLSQAGDVASHLILPAVTLSIVTIASTMRYQRGAMIEALQLDYIRTARAKGLPERTVVWRHAWRSSLGTMLTLFGLWLPLLLTGSVFVEFVFGWPGLGSLAAEAISHRDYPVIMGTAILAAAGVVSGTWLSDVLQMVLDPRVRRG